MLLTCPRCSRLNPTEALFCYHDGAALGDPSRRHAVTDPGKARFPVPFVFPSGKACHSFDELTLAIHERWKEARELLQHGVFASFLASLGRADLARSARELAAMTDGDRALDAFVRELPADVLEPPRLAVDPAQLNLGTMRVGQDFRFDLHLGNRGMGLLTGTVSCEDAPWLVLGGDGTHAREKLFQILHETNLSVQVRGKSFSAGNKPQVGRLVINSSGGRVVVPVTVEVPVTPFPDGALAGALTPRQVAQKARDHPKESADLFARGAVARWYEANGWTYPVQEPSASGLAAVQQFFEALGLTAPPKVEISAREVRLSGRGGDILRESLQVVAREKKPVFAHATCDQPWLTVPEIDLDGRTATVHLRVPEVPDRFGETLHARVSITSNGRQRFEVPVHLTVTAPMPLAMKWSGDHRGIEDASPALEPPPRRARPAEEVLPFVERVEEIRPAPKRERVREEPREEQAPPAPSLTRYALAALPVLFLTFGLLVALAHDLATWKPRAVEVAPGEVDPGKLPQELAIQFHDQEEPVLLTLNGSIKPTDSRVPEDVTRAVWEPSMRFGLQLLSRRGLGGKLTYRPRGQTNNTVVKLDGRPLLFGERPFRLLNGQYDGDWPGRWVDRDARVDRGMIDGRRSVWGYDAQQVFVTQTVGLVAGAQSNKVDTCLIHYRLENRDARPHSVGIRFLLDTFIGNNDGVPFLIPGSPQLCNTSRVFHSPAEVPDFIQARETEDLERPGTIALIQLRVPGYETPSRVTLGAWPNPELGPQCRQEKTLWDVPVLPMKSLGKGDSAVTIYWDERPLAPGKGREVAFAYGLGSVAASETRGQLGLSAAGSFTPGGEFTLTAEVRHPSAGQTLTLKLPEGFALAGGRAVEAVPPLQPGSPSPVSTVAWRVRAGPRAGTFTLRVASSTGVSQALPVRVRVRGIFGN
jgi:hypothetical protein